MDYLEVIAAFLDMERVDPAALKDALASEQGRQYLVDLVALREITADRAPALPTVPARVAPRVRWIRRLTAAAAVTVCAVGGYVAGNWAADSLTADERASFATSSVTGPSGARAGVPVAAPAPTSVIRFEAGVDWTETRGGN